MIVNLEWLFVLQLRFLVFERGLVDTLSIMGTFGKEVLNKAIKGSEPNNIVVFKKIIGIDIFSKTHTNSIQ